MKSREEESPVTPLSSQLIFNFHLHARRSITTGAEKVGRNQVALYQ